MKRLILSIIFLPILCFGQETYNFELVNILDSTKVVKLDKCHYIAVINDTIKIWNEVNPEIYYSEYELIAPVMLNCKVLNNKKILDFQFYSIGIYKYSKYISKKGVEGDDYMIYKQGHIGDDLFFYTRKIPIEDIFFFRNKKNKYYVNIPEGVIVEKKNKWRIRYIKPNQNY